MIHGCAEASAQLDLSEFYQVGQTILIKRKCKLVIIACGVSKLTCLIASPPLSALQPSERQ